jgi:alkylated DNA nucleotide flippase Atl1
MSDNPLNIVRSREELLMNLEIDRRCGKTAIYLGDPGLGKTEIIEQVSRNTTALPKGCVLDDGHIPKLVGFYASQHEGTDLSGYPVLSEDGEALEFKVMRKLQSLVSGDTLAIDEFTLAEPTTLKPCLQLLSGDRPCVNDWVGPDHITRVAMGNLAASGNIDYYYNPVMGNRVKLYEFTGPTVDEWLGYALQCAVHPAILAAIRMEGASLMLNWNPSRRRNPTPRSWFNASDSLLAAEEMFPEGVPMHVRLTQIAACVGDPAALQVETLLTLQDKLVPYRTVVESPGNAPVPDGYDDPAAQFLMATHVANKCVPDDWSAVMIYVERFPLELQQTIVAPIVARFPVLLTTTEYANFASRTSGLL